MLRDASGLFMAPGIGDTVIVLNENEPCSIIAYALRSVEYDEALKEKYRAMMVCLLSCFFAPQLAVP